MYTLVVFHDLGSQPNQLIDPTIVVSRSRCMQDAEQAALGVPIATTSSPPPLSIPNPTGTVSLPPAPTDSQAVSAPAALAATLHDANNTVASTPDMLRTAPSAVHVAGGHSGFRPPNAFTRPAHVSLRARLQASSELHSQRMHGESSRSTRSSHDEAQWPGGTEHRQQAHEPAAHTQSVAHHMDTIQGSATEATATINRQRGLQQGPDAFAYGRLARQMRFSNSESERTPLVRQMQRGRIEQQSEAAAAGPLQALAPRLRPESEALKRMLVDALLMLGYLHLDGEGTKRDNKEAVVALRRAAELGSDEARRTLGWMYNTGQFGE